MNLVSKQLDENASQYLIQWIKNRKKLYIFLFVTTVYLLTHRFVWNWEMVKDSGSQ